MYFNVISLYIIYTFTLICQGLPEEETVTYDMLYSAGIESYNAERWYECYAYMQRAIDDYKYYTDTVTDCRLQCRQNNPIKNDASQTVELEFFHTALKRSDCVRRCKAAKFGERPEEVLDTVSEDFINLEPYDYLQICAFKAEKFEIAAGAAYTYLLAHPDHEVMRNNVAYYQSVPEIKHFYFKNLEAKNHQNLYSEAVDFYGAEDWNKAIITMQEALAQYYYEYQRCQAACEGAYNHESLPDFYNAIADHFISVLKCQIDCPVKMATWSNTYIKNYLQEHYNYLQFAYYKVADLKTAAECVESFLRLDPTDETMLQNKVYYLKQDKLTLDDFKPTQAVRDYIQNVEKLKEMLTFVESNYKFSQADEDGKEGVMESSTSKTPSPESVEDVIKRTDPKKKKVPTATLR